MTAQVYFTLYTLYYSIDNLTKSNLMTLRTYQKKFKNLQILRLFSGTFHDLKMKEKFQDFQGLLQTCGNPL